MSESPAGPGWYDDPEDPLQLRYFDGVVWTAHTTPRVSPTADASTIGRAADVPAADTRVGWPQQPSQGAGGQAPWQGQWQGGRMPGQGGGAGGAGGAGGGSQAWRVAQTGVLPDGAVLAEWWRRLLARILDSIFAGVLALLVATPWLGEFVTVLSDLLDEAAAGGASVDTGQVASDLTDALLPLSLASLVVSLVYEVLFLAWRSATPGKMLLGTVVRRSGTAGPIGLVTALRRQVLSVLSAVMAFLPLLNVLASMLNIIDPAWLLWDPRRQTLHDKVADTVVVHRDRSA